MKVFKLLLLPALVLVAFQGKGQTTIAQARSQGAGANVAIKGIVLNGSELGLIRYIQDATGGIAAYSSSLSGTEAGDSVQVSGILKEFNNLLEIDPVSNFTVINKGNLLPAPKNLSLTEAFKEQYEGQLVSIAEVTFKDNGIFSGNTNYKITSGTAEKEIRINSGTDLVGAPIPAGKVTITGIMSQFYNIYQLLPRSRDDIHTGSGPKILTSVRQSDITTNSFSLSFETEMASSTYFRYGLTPSFEKGVHTGPAQTTSHKVELTGLQAATFYYVQGFTTNTTGDTSFTRVGVFSTASLSTGAIRAYFNQPVDRAYSIQSPAVYLDRTIDDTLAAYINKAQQTLDIAIYNFNDQELSPSLAKTINDAFRRGVVVRIVADGSTANIGLQSLDAGIPVIKSPSSQAYGIMHNKFVVIDANTVNNSWVWTGSTNFTDNQIFDDPNNAIAIQDQTLAKAYTVEFEEMWGGNGTTPSFMSARFGPFKQDNTPHLFNINGTLVEQYFSPSDATTSHLLDALRSADRELYFSLMLITRSDLGNLIYDEAQSGVFAAGIVNDTSNASNVYNKMKSALGSRLLLYQGSHILHHKYALVDPNSWWTDPQVITGSHNWSNAAENSNDENTLIIHNGPIANHFYQEWVKRYTESGGTQLYDFTTIGDRSYQPELLTKCYFSNGQLIMSFNDQVQSPLQMTLMDLQGRQVLSTQLKPQDQTAIPVAGLSHGMYVLTLTGTSGVQSVKVVY